MYPYTNINRESGRAVALRRICRYRQSVVGRYNLYPRYPSPCRYPHRSFALFLGRGARRNNYRAFLLRTNLRWTGGYLLRMGLVRRHCFITCISPMYKASMSSPANFYASDIVPLAERYPDA